MKHSKVFLFLFNQSNLFIPRSTIMSLSETSPSLIYIIGYFIGKFCLMFFASAAIGCLFGLVSAIVSFIFILNTSLMDGLRIVCSFLAIQIC